MCTGSCLFVRDTMEITFIVSFLMNLSVTHPLLSSHPLDRARSLAVCTMHHVNAQADFWYRAKVVREKDGQVLLHYLGWNTRHDEWMSRDAPRIAAVKYLESEEMAAAAAASVSTQHGVQRLGLARFLIVLLSCHDRSFTVQRILPDCADSWLHF